MNPSKLEKYIAKRAELSWPLVSGPLEGIEQVVAIPAFAEAGHLFRTFEHLAENPDEELRRTLVICVVNNRAAPFVEREDIQNNLDTLSRLESLRRRDSRLRLGYVNAASPGYEFPQTGGVGLARKIGLDWGLTVLSQQPCASPILFSLDADTRVEPNYLGAVRRHFARKDAWAGVAAYAHPIEGSRDEQAAIICYEFFLRYHVLGLRHARSPYAFPTIGSTMVCSPEAYVAAAGMNTRQAGEDFYFLQQLAKTGRVDPINTTTVYPSPRPSPRVPFGTGQRVRRFLANTHQEYRLYDPRSYAVLKSWLSAATARPTADAEALLGVSRAIHPELAAFLEQQDFARSWRQIRRNSGDEAHLRAQFHRWFDGFRTIKLIHHLRDHAYPESDMFAAIETLLEWLNHPLNPGDKIRDNLEQQKQLLNELRDFSAAHPD